MVNYFWNGQGLENGIVGMKETGRRLVCVPQSLAYGRQVGCKSNWILGFWYWVYKLCCNLSIVDTSVHASVLHLTLMANCFLELPDAVSCVSLLIFL